MKQSTVIFTAIAGTLLMLLIFLIFVFFQAGSFSSGMNMEIADNNKLMSDSISPGMNQESGQPNSAEDMSARGFAGNQEPQDMFFKNYGTHVFVSPELRPYSTFALDVDAASYTIAKNYIMNGMLPPKDAIRAEEFVNYFDYDYSNSEKNIDIKADLAESPFDENNVYMRIAVKAKNPEFIKPKKLTLVIDVSGSMRSGNRLGLLKKSLTYLVNNLNDEDYLSIITYNQNAKVHMKTQKGSDKDHILSMIEQLKPSGSTNAEAGLTLGYAEADNIFDAEYVNRVILLSDGVANVGTTTADGILAQLTEYKEKGITLTSIGVGLGNYNDVLLEQIADKADGNYFYINELDEGIRVFDKQLDATMELVGKDVKMQVEFNPDSVAEYRLIGYENRGLIMADFENESADAGEMGAGHEATALYELKLKNREGVICNVAVRYKNELESYEEKIIVSSTITQFSEIPDNFKLAISASRFAQILKRTSPPPQISLVREIVEGLEYNDITFTDFKDVISNAEVLIEQQQR